MERVPLIAGDKYAPEMFHFDPNYSEVRLTMSEILARAQAQVEALSLVSISCSTFVSRGNRLEGEGVKLLKFQHKSTHMQYHRLLDCGRHEDISEISVELDKT